ncbi:hypothetical protein N9P27_00890 [bacterium]|nr:hypothetical protein [bacterium]
MSPSSNRNPPMAAKSRCAMAIKMKKEHNCGLDKRSKKDNNAADHSICFQNAFITKAKAAQVIAPKPRFEGIEAGW